MDNKLLEDLLNKKEEVEIECMDAFDMRGVIVDFDDGFIKVVYGSREKKTALISRRFIIRINLK